MIHRKNEHTGEEEFIFSEREYKKVVEAFYDSCAYYREIGEYVIADKQGEIADTLLNEYIAIDKEKAR